MRPHAVTQEHHHRRLTGRVAASRRPTASSSARVHHFERIVAELRPHLGVVRRVRGVVDLPEVVARRSGRRRGRGGTGPSRPTRAGARRAGAWWRCRRRGRRAGGRARPARCRSRSGPPGTRRSASSELAQHLGRVRGHRGAMRSWVPHSTTWVPAILWLTWRSARRPRSCAAPRPRAPPRTARCGCHGAEAPDVVGALLQLPEAVEAVPVGPGRGRERRPHAPDEQARGLIVGAHAASSNSPAIVGSSPRSTSPRTMFTSIASRPTNATRGLRVMSPPPPARACAATQRLPRAVARTTCHAVSTCGSTRSDRPNARRAATGSPASSAISPARLRRNAAAWGCAANQSGVRVEQLEVLGHAGVEPVVGVGVRGHVERGTRSAARSSRGAPGRAAATTRRPPPHATVDRNAPLTLRRTAVMPGLGTKSSSTTSPTLPSERAVAPGRAVEVAAEAHRHRRLLEAAGEELEVVVGVQVVVVEEGDVAPACGVPAEVAGPGRAHVLVHCGSCGSADRRAPSRAGRRRRRPPAARSRSGSGAAPIRSPPRATRGASASRAPR